MYPWTESGGAKQRNMKKNDHIKKNHIWFKLKIFHPINKRISGSKLPIPDSILSFLIETVEKFVLGF